MKRGRAKKQRSKRRFGSHLPINIAITKTFPITGIMELGMGFLSTPFFLDCGVKFVSIEENAKWILKLKKTLTKNDNHLIVHNKVDMKKPNSPITDQIIEDSVRLYRANVEDSLNLLFVDNFDGLREPALVSLYQNFDFIVYHDSENGNRYNKLNTDADLYFKGEYILESNESIPSTGLLISTKYQNLIPQFEMAVKIEHDKIFKEHANGYELKWQ